MGTNRIIRGPPGERLDHFIERFIEYSEKNRISTYFILPTSRVVKHVQKQLHKRGIPYIKANITTLSGLSEAIFNQENCDSILLDNDQRAVIIDHLIEDTKNKIPLIGRMSASSGVSQSLATFFSLLGSYRESYPDCIKCPSAKSLELGFLREKYVEYLTSNSLLDKEMMMKIVSERDHAIETILLYGLFEPTPLEKDLIISLKNGSENLECYVPYIENEKIFKDDWSWIGIEDVEDVPADEFKNIFDGDNDKRSSANLSIGSIRDGVCEIRNVASEIRSILERKEDEKIAVVLPEPDGGQRLVSEIFEDYGIPFHVSRGNSLSESPLIQDLVNILRVVSHNFMRKDVVNLLRSPYIRFSFQGKEISGNEVENISIGANVICGKSGWNNSLQNRMKVLDDEIKNPDISEGLKKRHEIELGKLKFTQDAIEDLFSTIDRFSRNAPVVNHVNNFRKVIGKLEFYFDASSSSKPDASALKKFFSILEALDRNSALVPHSKISLSHFMSLLCSQVSRETYRPGQTNHSTVQIVGLRELAGLKFDHIFIVGMVEGEIPRIKLAHSFLNEGEIRKMNVLKRRDLLRQERYYFWTNLLAASKSIYLTCPETNDGNPLVQSHFIQQMMDEYEYETWGDNEVKGFRLMEQLKDGARINSGDFSNLTAGIDIPGLISRINSENYHRNLGRYTIYDGILKDDDVLKSIREEFSGERAFSPSSLEKYANCPFEFLLKYVLYLDTKGEVEEALTPLEKGNLIHHILFKFYTDRNGDKVTDKNSEDALDRILEIAEEEMDKFHFEGPAWENYSNIMLRRGKNPGLLQKFIENEKGFVDMGLEPRFFELSMGTKVDLLNRDPASVDHSVEIDLGGEKLKIKGKIDRVDVNGDDQFLVIDYKTGKLSNKKDMKEGKSLQLPIYLKALESLMSDLTGVGGAYYQIKDVKKLSLNYHLGDKNIKNDGNDPGFDDEMDTILEKVKGYLEGIREGRFHTINEVREKCPSYCVGKKVCRYVKTRPLEIKGGT